MPQPAGSSISLAGMNDVAGAVRRLDRPRPIGLRLDLLAQPVHTDIDAAIERVVAAPVREVEQLLARQNPVGMVGKCLQQVELHGGDRHLAAIQRKQAAQLQVEQAVAEADLTPAQAQRWRGCWPDPPQYALDPRQQLARVERLGDIIVSTNLEPDHAIHGVARCREHHDTDATAYPQLARKAEPIFARHPQIEDDQIDRPLSQHLAGRGDTLRDTDGKAFRDHKLLQ